MPARTLVIIPTYNEKENAANIVRAVLAQSPLVEVLVVDDGSPDGTGDIIETMGKGEPRVHLMRRAGKQGLGTAYIAGFKWALARDYANVMEMDADFSHDPNEIPNFLKAIETADLVLGSRYTEGVARVVNWPLKRLLLSKGASLYVRIITGLPIMDPTGGFKCFRRAVLEKFDFESVHSNGYTFQIEVTYKVWLNGFRIKEIPITFTDRCAGHSKMSGKIVREALWMVWSLAFANGFRRSPRR
jgi:dolichol-phosphate mannosyltransferase